MKKGFYYGFFGTAFVFVILISLGITDPDRGSTESNDAFVKSQVSRLVDPENHGHGGTGFALRAPSGKVYTVTNAHVCHAGHNGELQAQIGEGRGARFINLRILEISRVTDLCILDSVSGATGLSVAGSLRINEEVEVAGHPLLEYHTRSKGYVTDFETIDVNLGQLTDEDCTKQGGGSIATLFGNYCIRVVAAARTTATIFPGNSGSPVLDKNFQVVGVAFAANNTTNFGYIIPLQDLVDFMSNY